MSQTIAAPTSHRSVVHGTFSIERTYPASPARVFAACADEATKRRWFAEGEGWEVFEYTLDFRVDARETSRFRYMGGAEVRYDAVIQDIVPDRRIVTAYRMSIGPKPLSVCLATVELVPVDDGTLLRYTEQGAFFEGDEMLQGHEAGCRELLEKLATVL